MNGGAGDDHYDFNALANSGVTAATRDRIIGFGANANLDKIDLATIDANALVAGNQTFIFGGAFTAGHVRAVQSGANALIELNTDADAGAEMVIQLDVVGTKRRGFRPLAVVTKEDVLGQAGEGRLAAKG